MSRWLQLFAAAGDKIDINSGNNTTTINNVPTGTASDFLTAALNITYWIAGITAVIIIIVAGIVYATSSGEPSRTAKAKNTILYALIGLVLVILAFTITQFIIWRTS